MGSITIGQEGQVLGGNGTLTVANLPPKNLKRWIARRKAEIVGAVEAGLLSQTEACARYNISREEFSAWLDAYAREGVRGLRARAKTHSARRQVRPQLEPHAAPDLVHHTGLD